MAPKGCVPTFLMLRFLMPRTHNTTCSRQGCHNTFYRRPNELEKGDLKYCSMTCYSLVRRYPNRECLVCGGEFHPKNNKQSYCSKQCAGKGSRRPWSTRKKGTPRNAQQRRLLLLKTTFSFTSCMVKGCVYSKVYELHRFIPGKSGGIYEIGNMFAICPNHHAEITKGITRVQKIDNQTLEILGEVPESG